MFKKKKGCISCLSFTMNEKQTEPYKTIYIQPCTTLKVFGCLSVKNPLNIPGFEVNNEVSKLK